MTVIGNEAGATGYILDTPYTAEYFDDLHPARLYLAALLNGHVPPFDPDRPRYCELGCGNGMTLALLAAALPEGDFVGVDFNPAHIARARCLARRAGLTNVRFVEAAFGEEFAADETFDIIAAHGVYSWIDEDSRRALEHVAATRLHAGGLFHLSYNAQPRWAAADPGRKLVQECMAQRPDSGDVALPRSLALYDALRESGAGWFREPGEEVERLLGAGQRGQTQWQAYAVHEYGGRHWAAWYHCDVRRRLEGGVGLAYVGTTDFARAWPDAGGTTGIEETLAAIDEPALRETLRDYIVQPLLRREVYARGRLAGSGGGRAQRIDERRVALIPEAQHVTGDIDLPVGPARLDSDRLARLLAHLDAGESATIGRLISAMEPEVGGDPWGGRRLVLLLCRSRALQPIPVSEAVAFDDRVARFNHAVAEWAQDRSPFGAFLARGLGIGCPVGSLGQLVWLAVEAGVAPVATAIGDYLLDEQGVRVRGAGADRGDRTTIREAVAGILEGEWPRLNRLVGPQAARAKGEDAR